jgi:phenylalanyl-tRNA synthetase alpha chain
MIERIRELREQAEAEISAAQSAQELQELRVRHLGRRAELPQLLRGVAQLPPEQRGAVGAAANEARQALEALLSAPRCCARPSWAACWRPTAST